MIEENIIRYGVDGTLKWHETIQEIELKIKEDSVEEQGQ